MHVRFFGGEGWPLAVWLVSEPVLSHCTRLGIGRGHTRRRGFHSPRAAGDERGKVGRHCRRPAGGKETSGQRLAQAVHVRKWPCLLARGPFVDSTVTRPPPTRQQNLQPLPAHHPTSTTADSNTTRSCIANRESAPSRPATGPRSSPRPRQALPPFPPFPSIHSASRSTGGLGVSLLCE